jgi:large subunit ribosomal protein L30
MEMTAIGKVQVKLIKSLAGRLKQNQACVWGLGLRRLNQSVHGDDKPENRGMMNKVQ